MNQSLRSALIGIAAALAAYAGIVGVSHFAGESSPATLSDTIENPLVTPMVTPKVTPVTGGAKKVTPMVTPKVTPVTPTPSPSVTPRISPTPWHSTPTPTPSALSVASVTPTPSPTVSPTPSPTPWPSETPTPTPGETPTPTPTPTPSPSSTPEPQVVINEIAWAGTVADASDEWIELYNAGDSDVDLTGWTLAAADATPDFVIAGENPIIVAHGFYLLERTSDTVVATITADKVYTGGLDNDGEALILFDASGIQRDQIDCSAGWTAGAASSGEIPYSSMERGTDGTWHTGGAVKVGTDAEGNPINGTPGFVNSEG